jgi:hypothetical protein
VERDGDPLRHRPAADGTEVRFTHAGLDPAGGCFDAGSVAWDIYAGHSIRRLIVTGRGEPGSNPDEQRFQEKAAAGG